MGMNVAEKIVYLHVIFFPNRNCIFSLSLLDSKNNPFLKNTPFLFCFVLIYTEFSTKSVLLLTFGLN